MAELDVQPKRSNSWWLWLLLIIVVAAVLFFALGKRDGNTGNTVSDSTSAGVRNTTQQTPGRTSLTKN